MRFAPDRTERRLIETAPPWLVEAESVLDARLQRDVDHPVVVALSGGGDSMALLRIAADWAGRRGRGLLALTVDHGLNPASPAWSRTAERAARSLGAQWRQLHWSGPKPSRGLPAAARRARHRLLAEAARRAGGRVILMAHTFDDGVEAEYMRAQGSSLGRLRAWAPSPAWPEGRGLAVLRPLLGARRAEIRSWLAAAGAAWIEDPANEDVRFARARARLALSGTGQPIHPVEAGRGGEGVVGVEADVVELDRAISAAGLSAALVCAGGDDRPPRTTKLAALIKRLRSGEEFVSVLAGARLEAGHCQVRVGREAGERFRSVQTPQVLVAGQEAVWDGRWALQVEEPGWRATAARGLLARLSRIDRRLLEEVPPGFRGARPVLIRNDPPAALLAGSVGTARALVEERLALALDRMTHERDLGSVFHGAGAPKRLFSCVDIMNDGPPLRPEERDENEPA